MVTCPICGKKCKTAQGLRGHKTFVHSEFKADMQQSWVPVTTQQRLAKLERYVDALVGIADILGEFIGDHYRREDFLWFVAKVKDYSPELLKDMGLDCLSSLSGRQQWQP